jgi:cysteine-rich secretory family protein
VIARSKIKLVLVWLTLTFCSCFGNAVTAQAASPAEMISNYRSQHGEGRVTADLALNRIAQAQASAMAARDVLDHDVLGPFSSRAASSGSERAAENIAYGYETFEKTLGQWIDSTGHRKNLLLHGASRVGVASARSSTGKTYWAMVIAGGYERPKLAGPTTAPGTKPAAAAKHRTQAQQACRLKLLGLCL